MSDPLATILTERLGCRLPMIQTAMGWVAEPPLVAASCEAGAFGFLGAAVMTPGEAAAKIADVKRRTAKPFGVNFHMFQPGAGEIVETILANRDQVRAVSFGRGPDAKMIGRFKEAGILCVPTVGAVKHAKKMVELGCDMVTVQGGEGGGHTGAVATTVLLPQVLDAVKVPVIAAGGFADGRGLAAALAYGAVGIAMGTRFLLTAESAPPEAAKNVYLKAGTDDLRESPYLELIERLIGKGCDIRIFDQNVSLAKLVGANKAYLMNAIPHVTQLMVPSIEDAVEHSDVVVTTSRSPEYEAVVEKLRPDQILLDMARLPNTDRIAGTYDGINW